VQEGERRKEFKKMVLLVLSGSKKKANWAPGPRANFQEITMENMPVLPLEES
jgi:hypothetical protein